MKHAEPVEVCVSQAKSSFDKEAVDFLNIHGF
jgi:hypothetical protein